MIVKTFLVSFVAQLVSSAVIELPSFWPQKVQQQIPLSGVVNSIAGLPQSESNNQANEAKNPVILIPGYMGSQLEVQLSRLPTASPYCPRNTDHATDSLWFSMHNHLPYYEDCWVENIRLHYNPTSRRAYSDQGVFVAPHAFGNVSGVEFVSPTALPQTMYFYNLVQALESAGYTKDTDLLGAPYDWRKAPHENDEFMGAFKKLIEESVARTKKPAIPVCHSMGCTFTYAFLRDQSNQWKKDFIRGWIVLAAPFGGTFKYMYGYFGADDYPATISQKIRIPERTFSSTTFLLPNAKAFDGVPLVQTKSRNYTVNDYRAYFDALGNPDAYEQWLDTKDILGDTLSSPGEFPVYCVGGTGVQTLERTVFDGELSPGGLYTAIHGDGDGFLQTKSMRMCQSFSQGSTKFVHQEFNLDHMEIIQNSKSVNYIVSAVKDLNSPQEKSQ